MKKKIGPLPAWGWLVIVAAGAFLFYKYRRAREENTGVEEGFFPTQGIPSEGIPEGGGGGTGIEGLSSAIQALEAAGFVPAGSEAAERREAPEAAAAPSWWEEIVAGIVGERLAGRAGAAKKAGKAKTPPSHRQSGKGKGGRKRGDHGHGSSPQHPNTGHHPGHTQNPHHGAAVSPAQRARGGGGTGGGGGGKGGNHQGGHGGGGGRQHSGGKGKGKR